MHLYYVFNAEYVFVQDENRLQELRILLAAKQRFATSILSHVTWHKMFKKHHFRDLHGRAEHFPGRNFVDQRSVIATLHSAKHFGNLKFRGLRHYMYMKNIKF